MNELKDLYKNIPDWVTEEKLQEVFSHYEDGAFTFDLWNTELYDCKGNTVYHVIPRYAEDGAEDIIDKLRRIMSSELPKD